MANPNGQNPNFPGRVGGLAFEATHGNGVSATVAVTTGLTPVNVFGPVNNFKGTITSAYIISLDTTASNISLITAAGTVCQVPKGTVAGVMIGMGTLSNTAISLAGSVSVLSDGTGNARVVINYKVSDNLT